MKGPRQGSTGAPGAERRGAAFEDRRPPRETRCRAIRHETSRPCALHAAGLRVSWPEHRHPDGTHRAPPVSLLRPPEAAGTHDGRSGSGSRTGGLPPSPGRPCHRRRAHPGTGHGRPCLERRSRRTTAARTPATRQARCQPALAERRPVGQPRADGDHRPAGPRERHGHRRTRGPGHGRGRGPARRPGSGWRASTPPLPPARDAPVRSTRPSPSRRSRRPATGPSSSPRPSRSLPGVRLSLRPPRRRPANCSRPGRSRRASPSASWARSRRPVRPTSRTTRDRGHLRPGRVHRRRVPLHASSPTTDGRFEQHGRTIVFVPDRPPEGRHDLYA